MADQDTSILASVNSNETTRKEIAISEYKGNKYIQVRQRWRADAGDKEWLFSKKVVSFNYDDIQEIANSLKKNGINSFDDVLLAIDNS